MTIVTLLTDFGLADSYVAEVKAGILSVAVDAHLVDVSHLVSPGCIVAAQFLLARSWHRFPIGTVHVVVVDPGVGSERRALAAGSRGHFFVGPDNGVLSEIFDTATTVELTVPRDAAPSFHGRDVFAPAAARLAAGAALETLGPPVRDPVRSRLPSPREEEGVWWGEVVHVDRFGTLITNLPGAVVRGGSISVGPTMVPLARTFSDVESGGVVAFVGSGGTLEVAVRDGAAAAVLGVGVGASVRTR